jgi:hypothetical protein
LNNTLTGNAGNNTLDGAEGSDLLSASAGDDSYQFTAVSFGADTIDDLSGTDFVDLSSFAIGSVISWTAVDGIDGDGNLEHLIIDFGGGNSVTILNYYDNTSSSEDTSGAGAGHIETLIFSDNPAVDLTQVHAFVVG